MIGKGTLKKKKEKKKERGTYSTYVQTPITIKKKPYRNWSIARDIQKRSEAKLISTLFGDK